MSKQLNLNRKWLITTIEIHTAMYYVDALDEKEAIRNVQAQICNENETEMFKIRQDDSYVRTLDSSQWSIASDDKNYKNWYGINPDNVEMYRE